MHVIETFIQFKRNWLYFLGNPPHKNYISVFEVVISSVISLDSDIGGGRFFEVVVVVVVVICLWRGRAGRGRSVHQQRSLRMMY